MPGMEVRLGPLHPFFACREEGAPEGCPGDFMASQIAPRPEIEIYY